MSKKRKYSKKKCYKFIDGGKGRVEKKCNLFLLFCECYCLGKRGKQDKIREEKEWNQAEKGARREEEKENKIN